MLTNLQRKWQFVADQLGLSVQTPFEMQLPNGTHLEVEVLVRGYGAPKGTIVVSDFKTVAAERDTIMACGYTISSYRQPSDDDIESVEGYEGMLAEWGNTEKDKAEQGGDGDAEEAV